MACCWAVPVKAASLRRRGPIENTLAAAAVLTREQQAGLVYELAGDSAYTLAELAAEVYVIRGRTIAYQDLPQAEFQSILLGAGLPEGLAALLADSDVGASQGALFDDSHQQVITGPPYHVAGGSGRGRILITVIQSWASPYGEAFYCRNRTEPRW